MQWRGMAWHGVVMAWRAVAGAYWWYDGMARGGGGILVTYQGMAGHGVSWHGTATLRSATAHRGVQHSHAYRDALHIGMHACGWWADVMFVIGGSPVRCRAACSCSSNRVAVPCTPLQQASPQVQLANT